MCWCFSLLGAEHAKTDRLDDIIKRVRFNLFRETVCYLREVCVCVGGGGVLRWCAYMSKGNSITTDTYVNDAHKHFRLVGVVKYCL